MLRFHFEVTEHSKMLHVHFGVISPAWSMHTDGSSVPLSLIKNVSRVVYCSASACVLVMEV